MVTIRRLRRSHPFAGFGLAGFDYSPTVTGVHSPTGGGFLVSLKDSLGNQMTVCLPPGTPQPKIGDVWPGPYIFPPCKTIKSKGPSSGAMRPIITAAERIQSPSGYPWPPEAFEPQGTFPKPSIYPYPPWWQQGWGTQGIHGQGDGTQAFTDVEAQAADATYADPGAIYQGADTGFYAAPAGFDQGALYQQWSSELGQPWYAPGGGGQWGGYGAYAPELFGMGQMPSLGSLLTPTNVVVGAVLAYVFWPKRWSRKRNPRRRNPSRRRRNRGRRRR